MSSSNCSKKTIYLANPYGFSPHAKHRLLPDIISQLESLDLKVCEPFANISIINQRDMSLIYEIGRRCCDDVKKCDAIFAVVNGNPPDEGVAFELGYAKALNKPTFLFRDDFRVCADSPFLPINLMLVAGMPKENIQNYAHTSVYDIINPAKALYQWAKS